MYIAAFLILVIVVAGAFYWWQVESREQNYRAHIEKARQYEKQGKNEAAIKELQEALKYIPFNDASAKKQIEKKILTLKKEVEKSKKREVAGSRPGEGSSGGSDGGSKSESSGNDSGFKGDTGNDSTSDAQVPGATVDVKGVKLESLLPSSFGDMRSSPTGDSDVASVRFDDPDSNTTYIIYAYRMDSPEYAYERARFTTKEMYKKNAQEVKLLGDFSGQIGYYGENGQGDSILTFSFSSILFECLVRSDYLDTEGKKSKLIELAKGLKKP